MINFLKKIIEIVVTAACVVILLPGLVFKGIGFIFDSAGLLFTGMANYLFVGCDTVINFNCKADRFENF